MKKLVPESIEETLKVIKGEKLNESKMGDWLNSTKGLIQGVFKKVGNFLVAFFRDEPVKAVIPANIGIAQLSGSLPNAVQFVPSKEDTKLAPNLSKLTSDQLLNRVKKDYEEQKAKNKKYGGLKRLMEGNLIQSRYKMLREDIVKTQYGEGDKVRNIGSDFLIKRILMQYRRPTLVPPCIWGAPGIGKTAITKAVIKALGPGHRVIDVQTSKMAPDDWTLPAVKIYAEGGEIAKDIPKNWLPVYLPTSNDSEWLKAHGEVDPEEDKKRDDMANWGEGGVIFLDEISRASTEVQNTCLKLVHERMIGDKILGSKWAVVAASNRMSDDPEGGQTQMGSALANRFQHWNFVPGVDEWIEWAKAADIDDRITTFVDFNRDHFYVFDNESKLNTSPRSWEALACCLQAAKDFGDLNFSRADIETIVAGTVHPTTVEALMAFLVLIESFRPEDIMKLFNDPKNAPQPVKGGKGKEQVIDIPKARALIGAACSQSRSIIEAGKQLTAKQLENYIQYFIDLGNPSIASMALYLIVETHPYIHQETGDIKGKEKYKPAMDMFRAAFGKIKFGDRGAVMGG